MKGFDGALLLFCKGDIDPLTLAVAPDLSGVGVTMYQFNLTCISTGGPATTVTWTRDSESISNNDTFSLTTELNDALTAHYTHTLTVTGRLGGLYTCTVANDKPSEAVVVQELFIRGSKVDRTNISQQRVPVEVSVNKALGCMIVFCNL